MKRDNTDEIATQKAVIAISQLITDCLCRSSHQNFRYKIFAVYICVHQFASVHDVNYFAGVP